MNDMAGQHSKGDAERLAHGLADLFDSVSPAGVLEAHEELHSAGIDPTGVGARSERLADEMLDRRPRTAGEGPRAVRPARTAVDRRAAPRRRRTRWAIAAGLAGCGFAWAMFRASTGAPLLPGSPPPGRVEAGPEVAQLSPWPAPVADNAVRSAEPSVPGRRSQPAQLALPGHPALPAQPGQESVPARAEPAGHAVAGSPIREAASGVGVKASLSADDLASALWQLSPGLSWAVSNGLRIERVDPRPIPIPAAYQEATARYGATTSLAADGLTLEHYVAGLPFPNLDLNDPNVAVKMMWNYEYRPFATDDFRVRNVSVDTGKLGENGAHMSIERHYVVGRFQRAFYNGRLFAEPRPARAEDPARYREILDMHEPTDVAGTAEMTVRYQDPTREDDTWVYVPALRRFRRVTSAQRSETSGQDIDLDSLLGYSGRIGSMTWRLLGETVVPGCMHAQNEPVKWGEGSGDFAFDDVWEPRRAYVLEGVPKLESDAFGKRVLYIDQETWVVLSSDLYDRQGALWKVWLNLFSVPPPNGEGTQHAGMLTNRAAVMIDTQRRHATRSSVDGRPDKGSGWSFDRGDLLDELTPTIRETLW